MRCALQRRSRPILGLCGLPADVRSFISSGKLTCKIDKAGDWRGKISLRNQLSAFFSHANVTPHNGTLWLLSICSAAPQVEVAGVVESNESDSRSQAGFSSWGQFNRVASSASRFRL